MKKRISLLLAVVMVLGSFASVFASDVELTPYEAEAANFLYENEILVGNTAGLLLGEELIRQDSVILLSRLLGEEDEATSHAIADSIKKFTDLPNDNYYKRNISWAVENEYYQGTSNTTFSPKRALRVEEYATILVRALGYGEADWKKSYDKAEELGLLANVNVEGPKQDILRKDVALMTFNALKTNVKGKDITLAEELGIVLPEEDVKIKALSSRKIEVEFEKALTKDEQAKVKFVVKDENGKELALNPVVWDKDGKKAVIQRNYELTFRDGDYTVEVKGEGINAKETLTITRSKAQKLEIEENVVSVDGNTTYKVDGKDRAALKLTINVIDQYGAKTEAKDVTVAAKNLTTGVTLELAKGKDKAVLKDTISLVGEDGKSLVKEGDIISVTALDKGTALSTTKKIEVVAGSVVDELAMGDVVIVKDNKVVDAYVSEDTPEVYIEVIALDQYGKKVDLNSVSEKDKIKFFTTGLVNEVIELSNSTLVEGKTKDFLNKDSQYIELSGEDVVKTNVNEASIYGVIVRSTGVENSNVVKFDVVSAGGAVEFKLDGFEPVMDAGIEKDKDGKDGKEVKLKFFNKLGKEVTEFNNGEKVTVTVKAPLYLDTEEVKNNGEDEIKLLRTKDYKAKEVIRLYSEEDIDGLSEEAAMKLELKDSDDKVLATIDRDIVVTKPVKGYEAKITTDKDNFVAGDEIEVEVTAYSDETNKEVHTSYNKTEAVEVEVEVKVDGKDENAQRYFRNAKFVNGVAKIKVPLTKTQEGNVTVTIPELKGVEATTDNKVTVKAANVEKFELEGEELKAKDKYGNVNEEYTGKKTGKATVGKGIEVEQIDAEGNVLVTFNKGLAKFEVTGEGKIELEIDGIKSVIEVKAEKTTETDQQ